MSLPVEDKKNAYSKPELTCYGDLTQVTMGLSPGVGDSLDPFTRKSDFGPGPPRG